MNSIKDRDDFRASLKDRKRIVVKIGTSSLTHPETGALNLIKLEKLVRELCDLQNAGRDVILVSSGAIAVGRQAVHIDHRPRKIQEKQACAAIGQAQLMMIYQKLFQEYGHISAQILLTKDTIDEDLSRYNAVNTFEELLSMGVIPVVNENDTISTYEIQFGDNDSLSARVAALVRADLLILLSDIDGLYTDDPRKNENASFIPLVRDLSEVMHMGKGSESDVGTGGMETKLHAAQIAGSAGVDMIIANGDDFSNIHRIMRGDKTGTLFLASGNRS
ncbi:MAG: glutamate 5-kinase [Lachnospiraceae bacterium]|nr:glutamate 5-kinase [Lachnospiraceae bacterium]